MSIVTKSVLFLIVNTGLMCYSQETHVVLYQKPDHLLVTAFLEDAPVAEVLTSLDDGLEAEIFFQFRLYEKAKGLFAFLGDKLTIEKQPYYRARKNFYDNTYVIIHSDGSETGHKSSEEFVDHFLRIESYELADFATPAEKGYYLRSRIRLNHAKLVPPLNLIYLFYSVGVSTDWNESMIAAAPGAAAPGATAPGGKN